eukprot:6483061-Alexandrium_andersonii.AAC.1
MPRLYVEKACANVWHLLKRCRTCALSLSIPECKQLHLVLGISSASCSTPTQNYWSSWPEQGFPAVYMRPQHVFSSAATARAAQ